MLRHTVDKLINLYDRYILVFKLIIYAGAYGGRVCGDILIDDPSLWRAERRICSHIGSLVLVLPYQVSK